MLRQRTTLTVSGSQTNSSQVSAVAGRRIRVIGFTITATSATATTVQFTDVTTTSALSGTYEVPGSSTINIPSVDNGYGDTASGHALGVTTGSGAVTIDLIYEVK